MEQKLLDIIDKYFYTLEQTGDIDLESAMKLFKALSLYDFHGAYDEILDKEDRKSIEDAISCLLNIGCFNFVDIDICDLRHNEDITDVVVSIQHVVNYYTYDKHYTYSVSSPVTELEIFHNLDKHPSVTAVDNTGAQVELQVVYTSLNSVTISSNQDFVGYVYFN